MKHTHPIHLTRRTALAALPAALLWPDTGRAQALQSTRLQSWPLNTPRQGARRAWSDSLGRIWVAEWNSGNLSMHDPALGTGANSWRTWRAPGASPRVYAVYVDDKDIVWAAEWNNNAVLRFDPRQEKFDVLTLPRPNANIRQILGRPGEVWLPESGTEFISVIRTA